MSLNQKPIFKTSSSLFLRLGVILAGLVLLVILLAQLTWFLGRWGQEQDIQHLETTLGTNIEASRVSTLSPGAAFRPMTKDEFCHMEGRVHTVGEWTKARIFNQSPIDGQKILWLFYHLIKMVHMAALGSVMEPAHPTSESFLPGWPTTD